MSTKKSISRPRPRGVFIYANRPFVVVDSVVRSPPLPSVASRTCRLKMLRNSELDCLIALEDLTLELTALEVRTVALTRNLRSVRAEIRSLEQVAA